MSTSTYSEQFHGAYAAAKSMGGTTAMRNKIEANRRRLESIEGGRKGVDAVMLGLDAYDMGMTDAEVRAWAERI